MYREYTDSVFLALVFFVLLAGGLCYAGESYSSKLDAQEQQMYIQDTLADAEERGVAKEDIAQEILLSIADEVGYWKLIIGGLVLVGSAGGLGTWGTVRLVKGRRGRKNSDS